MSEVQESLSIQCVLWLRSDLESPDLAVLCALGRTQVCPLPYIPACVLPADLPHPLPSPQPKLALGWAFREDPSSSGGPSAAKYLGIGARPTPGSRSAPGGRTRSRPRCASVPTAMAAPGGSALSRHAVQRGTRRHHHPSPMSQGRWEPAGAPGCVLCAEHVRAGWGSAVVLPW